MARQNLPSPINLAIGLYNRLYGSWSTWLQLHSHKVNKPVKYVNQNPDK